MPAVIVVVIFEIPPYTQSALIYPLFSTFHSYAYLFGIHMYWGYRYNGS